MQAVGSLHTGGRGLCHCARPWEPDTTDGLVGLSMRSLGTVAMNDCPRTGQGRAGKAQREVTWACSDPDPSESLLRVSLCRALHTAAPWVLPAWGAGGPHCADTELGLQRWRVGLALGPGLRLRPAPGSSGGGWARASCAPDSRTSGGSLGAG